MEDKAFKLCRGHFKHGCGLWALPMKITQSSLGAWDGKYGSIVTIHRIYLSWRVDLCNFSRETLQEARGNS